VVWYTFEPKRNPEWAPYVGDPFDMSLDPVKMPQMAAGALMFLRGDLEPAKKTIERSYSREQVRDSRFLPGSERPYFTPGFPPAVPLLHGSRVRSFAGEPTAAISVDASRPYKSDTGQLAWHATAEGLGLVTIDSPRSQGLIGFVKANGLRVSNLAANVRNDFCAVVVNSLESQPIAGASRLLLHHRFARREHRHAMGCPSRARHQSGPLALVDRTRHGHHHPVQSRTGHKSFRPCTRRLGPSDRRYHPREEDRCRLGNCRRRTGDDLVRSAGGAIARRVPLVVVLVLCLETASGDNPHASSAN
jgi:hypothetical protein